MKVVDIFCKGSSLICYDEFEHKPELVVLVNDFYEVAHVKGMMDFLKEVEVNIVLNMVPHAASKLNEIDIWNTLNVTKLVRPYLVGVREPGSSGQSIPLEENFLQEHHKEFMYEGRKYPYDYPGTGMGAIAYTIVDCKPDILNIVGLDFYDNLNHSDEPKTNYLFKCPEGRDYNRDLWSIEEMQKTLCDLIESRPNMKVNIKTRAKTFMDRLSSNENVTIEIIEQDYIDKQSGIMYE
jgi:hypothetical protein|tara:strand:+ start:188 stop:898 length:711 start_codon:yes stop_codon:yes gene_type:complete